MKKNQLTKNFFANLPITIPDSMLDYRNGRDCPLGLFGDKPTFSNVGLKSVRGGAICYSREFGDRNNPQYTKCLSLGNGFVLRLDDRATVGQPAGAMVLVVAGSLAPGVEF